MELHRRGPGEATLLVGEREVLHLVAAEGGEEEFEALAARIAQLLRRDGLPRIAVTYQEGLLGAVHAELPVELVFVEEDLNDEPPVQLRRRTLVADPAAVEAAIALAERRAGRGGAR